MLLKRRLEFLGVFFQFFPVFCRLPGRNSASPKSVAVHSLGTTDTRYFRKHCNFKALFFSHIRFNQYGALKLCKLISYYRDKIIVLPMHPIWIISWPLLTCAMVFHSRHRFCRVTRKKWKYQHSEEALNITCTQLYISNLWWSNMSFTIYNAVWNVP